MESINIENLVKEAFEIGMIQDSKEITDFCNFIKSKNIKNVLEIGSAQGGTFFLWCNIADNNGKKISLDLPYEHLRQFKNYRNSEMLDWSDNVYIIEGDSHSDKSFEKVKEILNGEKLDLLFIDGDHSYEGVTQDYTIYKNLVKEGGIIAFHGINGDDNNRVNTGYVSEFWKEINDYKIDFNSNYPYHGIGVIIKNNQICNNSIFVIGAWIDNDFKREILIRNIKYIKSNFDIPILLVTHCFIDKEIIDMVDYFIYDKENNLLHSKDYKKYGNMHSFFYWNNDAYSVTKIWNFRHDYTVYTNMRNAFIFIDYLGKENIFYLEYDCIPDDNYFSDFIEPLGKYDACCYFWDEFKLATNYFSIKTKKIIPFINKYKSSDEYFSYCSKSNTFIAYEDVFSIYLRDNNISVHSLNTKCRNFDLCGIGSFFIPIITIDNKGVQFIFCKKDDQVYLFIINNTDIILNYSFLDAKEKINLGWNLIKIGDENYLKDKYLEESVFIYRDKDLLKSFEVDYIIEESKLGNICIM